MNSQFKKIKNELIGVILLSAGLFLALSLASYSPRDFSFNNWSRNFHVVNYCGIVGSVLADIFYQTLGLPAWAAAFLLLRASYRTLKTAVFEFRDLKLIWFTLFIVTVATFLQTYGKETKIFDQTIFLGGLVGYSLSAILLKAFNFIGLQLMVWTSLLVLGLFYSEKGFKGQMKLVGYLLTKISEGIKSFIKAGYRGMVASVQKRAIKEKVLATKAMADRRDPVGKADQILFSGVNDINDDVEILEDKPVVSAAASAAPYVAAPTKRKVQLKIQTPRRVANWEMPKLSLLEDPPATRIKIDEKEIRRRADIITEKLKNFDIEGKITDAKPGPLVTLYEFKPNVDVKISKIGDLEDDLSLALSSESVRYVGHIPGRDVVGIETANAQRETVYFKDLMVEENFWNEDFALPMGLGRQVNGESKIVDLRKMPHLLIAGTTGSGKSVFVGSIITGLLFRHSPKTLRLVLIDPKMVDLAAFSKVPHLILPHITEAKKAAMSLKWSVKEMEKRYRSLSKFGVSKIELFNEKVSKLSKEEIAEHEAANLEDDQYYYQTIPYIVIVVDELADLMVTEKQNVEQPIQRLTQMARACGMHLILATQSPRKDVVTGLIKTNIPGRIGLKVASKMDSRIILDDNGAERLLPNGDMLFLAPGVAKPMRHHGPFIPDRDIQSIVKFWSAQGEPEYDQRGVKMLEGKSSGDGEDLGGIEGMDEEHDEMYDQILAWTADQKEVSASLLQRKFRLGYPRAARLIEVFEKEGVVGPPNGSKPRQVLVGSFRDHG
ncbi:MAG: DNA translocase FtsK 4TM domain-containing protein [Bdellovibrionota bacterium]